EHFHVSVRPEHDVLRLDVAMDNAGLVGGSERTHDLDHDVNSFTQRHSPTAQTLPQCLAFDQFTRDVVDGLILADLVNRQNIWMVKADYGARFLLKALQAFGVAGKARGEEFERSFT